MNHVHHNPEITFHQPLNRRITDYASPRKGRREERRESKEEEELKKNTPKSAPNERWKRVDGKLIPHTEEL